MELSVQQINIKHPEATAGHLQGRGLNTKDFLFVKLLWKGQIWNCSENLLALLKAWSLDWRSNNLCWNWFLKHFNNIGCLEQSVLQEERCLENFIGFLFKVVNRNHSLRPIVLLLTRIRMYNANKTFFCQYFVWAEWMIFNYYGILFCTYYILYIQ